MKRQRPLLTCVKTTDDSVVRNFILLQSMGSRPSSHANSDLPPMRSFTGTDGHIAGDVINLQSTCSYLPQILQRTLPLRAFLQGTEQAVVHDSVYQVYRVTCLSQGRVALLLQALHKSKMLHRKLPAASSFKSTDQSAVRNRIKLRCSRLEDYKKVAVLSPIDHSMSTALMAAAEDAAVDWMRSTLILVQQMHTESPVTRIATSIHNICKRAGRWFNDLTLASLSEDSLPAPICHVCHKLL